MPRSALDRAHDSARRRRLRPRRASEASEASAISALGPVGVRVLLSGVAVASILALSHEAQAQSIGIGFGGGFPIQTFVEGEADREFRVSPEPGYYPTLQDRTNEIGSFHFNLSLLIHDFDLFVIFDDLEIRFDISSFGWSTAEVTHTSCSPIEVVGSEFDDATVQYLPIDDAECLGDDYDSSTDISELELPALQVFDIGVGGRAVLLDRAGWNIWWPVTVGLVISTFADPDAEFFLGASLASGAGVGFSFSDSVSMELESRYTFMVTEAPDSIQRRLNNEPQTEGNIVTTVAETFSWVDIQLALRFAF